MVVMQGSRLSDYTLAERLRLAERWQQQLLQGMLEFTELFVTEDGEVHQVSIESWLEDADCRVRVRSSHAADCDPEVASALEILRLAGVEVWAGVSGGGRVAG